MCTATSGPLAKFFGTKTDPVGQPAFAATTPTAQRRSPNSNGTLLTTAPATSMTGNSGAPTLLGN